MILITPEERLSTGWLFVCYALGLGDELLLQEDQKCSVNTSARVPSTVHSSIFNKRLLGNLEKQTMIDR